MLRKEMEKYYYMNIERYILEHPSEFVLINTYGNSFEETFFETEEEMNKLVGKKYGGRAQATYFKAQVPASLEELIDE